MGVTASLTISVIEDESLWGLIACHQYKSGKYLPYEIRAACETLGRLISAQLPVMKAREVQKSSAHANFVLSRLDERMRRGHSIQSMISDRADLMDTVTGCTGAAIRIEETWQTIGDSPSPEKLDPLCEWLNKTYPDQSVIHTDSLARSYADAALFSQQASGLLAIRIPRNSTSWVLWFKPWLFGGYGNASGSSSGYLSDLWKYSITANTWTWVAGANAANVTGARDLGQWRSEQSFLAGREIRGPNLGRRRWKSLALRRRRRG